MIGMAVRDGNGGDRKDVRAQCQGQALAGIDEQLKGLMPQPIGVKGAAETAETGWRHDTHDRIE